MPTIAAQTLDVDSSRQAEKVSDRVSQSSYSINHQRILQRALAMQKETFQPEREKTKGSLGHESRPVRIEKPPISNIKVVSSHEDEQASRLSGRTSQRSSKLGQMANEMYSESRRSVRERRLAALQKIIVVRSRRLLRECLSKFNSANEDLWQKQEALERKQKKLKLADRTLKAQVLQQWISTHAMVVHQNKQFLKALNFHRNNSQIKLKLIFFYMRKVLRKQGQTIQRLQKQFFDKHHLRPILQEWRNYCTKICKIERVINANRLKNCFSEMQVVAWQENELVQRHRRQTLRFKILYILKKRAGRKKYLRGALAVARARREARMQKNAIGALKERVQRNQEWRKDLVKRYWINNSDSEDETVDSSQGMVAGAQDGFFENPGSFKDEFFPVKVCR